VSRADLDSAPSLEAAKIAKFLRQSNCKAGHLHFFSESCRPGNAGALRYVINRWFTQWANPASVPAEFRLVLPAELTNDDEGGQLFPRDAHIRVDRSATADPQHTEPKCQPVDRSCRAMRGIPLINDIDHGYETGWL
jgi:hypothetical protein